MRGSGRVIAAVALVVIALLLQVTVLPALGWPDTGVGAVPDVVLLVVAVTALATDTRFATITGFGAGLFLDVAPPADHVAGRWALALMVVGYVVGRLAHDDVAESVQDMRRERRTAPALVVASVLGGSFLGNVIYALTGIVLHDLGLGSGQVLRIIGIGMGWDLLAALLVVPAGLAIYRRVAQLDAGEPIRVR